jgi:hypothetical protein
MVALPLLSDDSQSVGGLKSGSQAGVVVGAGARRPGRA